MVVEGSLVAYVGADGGRIGSQGRVLSADYDTLVCHVLWTTGSRIHQVDAVYADDLAVQGRAPLTTVASYHQDLLADSLETEISATAARQAYETGGPRMVVEYMAQLGNLGVLADLTQDVFTTAAARIRHDPLFLEATAGLDDDERDDVVRLSVTALLHETFGLDEDDDE